jgi:hypothetical protein
VIKWLHGMLKAIECILEIRTRSRD